MGEKDNSHQPFPSPPQRPLREKEHSKELFISSTVSLPDELSLQLERGVGSCCLYKRQRRHEYDFPHADSWGCWCPGLWHMVLSLADLEMELGRLL